VPLALLEAMALNSKQLRFRTFWRALYFAPIVTSSVAIGIVFRMLYNKDYGLLNEFIAALGGMPVDWLGNQGVVKVAVMVATGGYWMAASIAVAVSGLTGGLAALARGVDCAFSMMRSFSTALSAPAASRLSTSRPSTSTGFNTMWASCSR